MDFIIFILSTVGATFITTQSYLFKKIRDKACKINPFLGKLLKCTQCSGFYWGVIIQLIILFHYRNNIILYYSDFYYIIYGFIGSIVCYVSFLLLKSLMDKYD